MDLARYFSEQAKEAQNKAKRRKLKWQTLVYAFALLRFFLLGTLELSTQINYLSSSSQVSYLAGSAATTAFSYLFFGSIVDNMPFESHRLLFCGIEATTGLWFLIIGGIYVHDSNICSNSTSRCSEQSILLFSSFSYFLTSAFQIMITLQLFNWFSKRRLGAVIGFWLLIQACGVIVKFAILGQYQYFPDFQLAIQ